MGWTWTNGTPPLSRWPAVFPVRQQLGGRAACRKSTLVLVIVWKAPDTVPPSNQAERGREQGRRGTSRDRGPSSLATFAAPWVAFVPGVPQLGIGLGDTGRGQVNGRAGCVATAAQPATVVRPGANAGTSPAPLRGPAAASLPSTSPAHCRRRNSGSSASSATPGAPRRSGCAACANRARDKVRAVAVRTVSRG